MHPPPQVRQGWRKLWLTTRGSPKAISGAHRSLHRDRLLRRVVWPSRDHMLRYTLLPFLLIVPRPVASLGTFWLPRTRDEEALLCFAAKRSSDRACIGTKPVRREPWRQAPTRGPLSWMA